MCVFSVTVTCYLRKTSKQVKQVFSRETVKYELSLY